MRPGLLGHFPHDGWKLRLPFWQKADYRFAGQNSQNIIPWIPAPPCFTGLQHDLPRSPTGGETLTTPEKKKRKKTRYPLQSSWQNRKAKPVWFSLSFLEWLMHASTRSHWFISSSQASRAVWPERAKQANVENASDTNYSAVSRGYMSLSPGTSETSNEGALLRHAWLHLTLHLGSGASCKAERRRKEGIREKTEPLGPTLRAGPLHRQASRFDRSIQT